MKKSIITLVFAILSCSMMLAEDMPVLRLTIPGGIGAVKDYVMGSMQLTDTNGSVVALNAKFKSRGATAKEYSMKPSLNMKLRDEQGEELDSMLLGLRSCSSWILDAMAIDRICMRNRVAFDIWNEFGKLPYTTQFGSRNGTIGRFVEVYINDVYKGIYCLSDKINRKLLDLKKPQIDTLSVDPGASGIVSDSIPAVQTEVTIRGVLYKSGTTDILNQNDVGYFNDYQVYVARWHDAWELSEPEDYACEKAWKGLNNLYENYKDYAWVEKNCYMDNIADISIFTLALSINDNWGNKNRFVSIRNLQATGNKARMVFTPWDLDTSLGGHYKGLAFGGDYSSSNWPVTSAMNNPPIPYSTCFMNSDFKEQLKVRWDSLRRGALSVANVAKKMRRYSNLFVTSGAWKRQWNHYMNEEKYQPLMVEDLAKEVAYIIEWYKGRTSEMDTYFGLDPYVDPTALAGDANEDGSISVADLSLMASYILGTSSLINFDNADINGDGTVSVADISLLASKILSGN